MKDEVICFTYLTNFKYFQLTQYLGGNTGYQWGGGGMQGSEPNTQDRVTNIHRYFIRTGRDIQLM